MLPNKVLDLRWIYVIRFWYFPNRILLMNPHCLRQISGCRSVMGSFSFVGLRFPSADSCLIQGTELWSWLHSAMKVDPKAQKFGHAMLSFLQHFQFKPDLIKAKADICIQSDRVYFIQFSSMGNDFRNTQMATGAIVCYPPHTYWACDIDDLSKKKVKFGFIPANCSIH